MMPPAGLGFGMPRVREWGLWVTGEAGIPSRRRQRRSRPGAEVQVGHARADFIQWTSAPGPLRDKLADVTGSPLLFAGLRQASTPQGGIDPRLIREILASTHDISGLRTSIGIVSSRIDLDPEH